MASGTLTNDGLNAAANGVTVTHLSLHSGAPGATGVNEVSGGGYARKTVSFGTAVNGVRTASGSPVAAFDGPSNSTVHSVGMWNGSTFVGSMQLSAGAGDDTTFNASGKINVNTATLTVRVP